MNIRAIETRIRSAHTRALLVGNTQRASELAAQLRFIWKLLLRNQ